MTKQTPGMFLDDSISLTENSIAQTEINLEAMKEALANLIKIRDIYVKHLGERK